MMRDQEKPFICYKSGWSMKIVPRNAAGWRAMALWFLPIIPITALFLMAMNPPPSDATGIKMTIVYVGAMAVWAIAMIRWMMNRSEIIDLKELIEIKQKQDADRKKKRR